MWSKCFILWHHTFKSSLAICLVSSLLLDTKTMKYGLNLLHPWALNFSSIQWWIKSTQLSHCWIYAFHKRRWIKNNFYTIQNPDTFFFYIDILALLHHNTSFFYRQLLNHYKSFNSEAPLAFLSWFVAYTNQTNEQSASYRLLKKCLLFITSWSG